MRASPPPAGRSPPPASQRQAEGTSLTFCPSTALFLPSLFSLHPRSARQNNYFRCFLRDKELVQCNTLEIDSSAKFFVCFVSSKASLALVSPSRPSLSFATASISFFDNLHLCSDFPLKVIRTTNSIIQFSCLVVLASLIIPPYYVVLLLFLQRRAFKISRLI